MAPVPFNSENFSTFIGVTKYVEPGVRDVGGENDLNGDLDDDNAGEIGNESFDSQVDEIEERRYLKAYWRADEGSGNQISDITDRQMHLEVIADSELIWSA